MKYAELSIAWDYATDTARILGHGRHTYADASDTDICMTGDLVVIREDVGLVRDYKTGHGYVTPAQHSAQLHVLALGVSRVFGLESIMVEFMHIKEPTAFGDRFPSDQFWVTRSHLDAMKARIHGMVAELMSDEPPAYREGMQCRYCPSWDWCPPKKELLQLLAGGLEFEPGIAYQKTRELETRAKIALTRLREYSDVHGLIELGNGRVYGRSPSGKYEEHTR